jgi:tetratricopeptide (TPR) repeat protein/tRNA A-37 threonylcarbamoyl transferase component Bud32
MKVVSPGALIGKYPVTRLLSAGGMGMVYEAVHPILGTRVAIKTIRPELAHDARVVDRFFKEALATSRIRDERLPQIFDQARLPDDTPYMVMELLEGEDLGHRLARGPLEPRYATRVMLEVLEVLDRVHRLGIIHRDLKPQNIFLAKSELLGEVPKLLDFGVAHFETDAATRPGEVMGTPLYMALEQSDTTLRVGAWTDVFSAGVVLYEAIAGAGRRPWGAVGPLAYLAALDNRTPPRPLTDLVPEVPVELADVLTRALDPEPEARFADALSFARALEPFAEARGALYARRTVASGAPLPAEPSGLEDTLYSPPSDITFREPGRPTPPVRPVARDAAARLSARLAGLLPHAPRPRTADTLRPGERRPVTLLALVVQVEAAPGYALDAEQADALVDEITPAFRASMERAGGRVHRAVGRGLLATFGHDAAAEDDTDRALGAGLSILAQRATIDAEMRPFGCGVTVRGGVHQALTRVADDGGDADLLRGDAAEVVVALQQAAAPNTVLVSAPARAAGGDRFQWRSVGSLKVKGRSETVEASELGRDQEVPSRRRSQPGAARPVVGRADELAQLEALYQRVAAGDAQVRVVELFGPPGAGKSRLAHALADRLAARARAVTLVAQPLTLQPYGLWVSVLRQLLFGGDERRPATYEPGARLAHLAVHLGGEDREALLSLTDVARVLLGVGRDDLGDDPEGMAGRILQLISLSLRAAARQTEETTGRPMAVILDDLHRADAASMQLLPLVVPRLSVGAAPLLVAVTRAGDAGAADDPTVHRLQVGPLPAADADALLDAVADGRPTSAAARALVHERAAGNPLFVEELVRALAARQMLNADAGALRHFALPDSLYGLLLHRVSRLPRPQRQALQRLAVVGPLVEDWLWRGVAERLGDEEAADEAALFALARQDFIARETLADGVRYRFRQHLLRDAVYGSVLPDNRRVLHRIAAETIEAQPAVDARSGPRLLYHWERAEVPERTRHHALRVGRHRLRLGAYEEAVHALTLAVSLGAADGPDALAAAGVRGTLAHALFYLGRFDDAEDHGRAAIERLAPVVTEATAPAPAVRQAAEVRVVLAQVAHYRSDWEQAQEELEWAEHLFERAGEPVKAATARSALGFVLRSLGRTAEGLDLAREAWTVLSGGDDEPALVRAGHDLGNLLRDLGHHEEALEVFDRAIEIGDALVRAGQLSRARWAGAARSGRALVYLALGRLDEAVADQRQVYDDTVQAGNLVGQTVSGFHLADALAHRGDLDAARLMGERVLETAGRVGMPDRALKARLLLARLAHARGHVDVEREHLEAAEFLARRTQGGDAAWLDVVERLLPHLMREGRDDEANSLLREARERAGRVQRPAYLRRVEAIARSARDARG